MVVVAAGDLVGRQAITDPALGNLIMDAVRRGGGLTYTARCFVDMEIQSGQLAELFSENDTSGYYIVTPHGVLRPPCAGIHLMADASSCDRAKVHRELANSAAIFDGPMMTGYGTDQRTSSTNDRSNRLDVLAKPSCARVYELESILPLTSF
jgi:hypothetical protein